MKSLFQFCWNPAPGVSHYQTWLTTFHFTPAWIICGWIEENGSRQRIGDRGRAVGGGRNEGLGSRKSMRKHGFSSESTMRLVAKTIQTSRINPFPRESKCKHEATQELITRSICAQILNAASTVSDQMINY